MIMFLQWGYMQGSMSENCHFYAATNTFQENSVKIQNINWIWINKSSLTRISGCIVLHVKRTAVAKGNVKLCLIQFCNLISLKLKLNLLHGRRPMHEVLYILHYHVIGTFEEHDWVIEKLGQKFDAIVYSDVNTTKGIHSIILHSCPLHLNYVDSNSSKQF